MRDALCSLGASLVLFACGGPDRPPAPPAGGTGVATGAAILEPPPPPIQEALRPPATERRAVTDSYHGVTVEDPYRWLEGDTADVTTWSEAQARYTRALLDGMPARDVLRDELTAIVDAPVTRYTPLGAAGGKLFALRREPGHEQASLIVMADPDDAATARLILDPVARHDALTTIDWAVPSPDGTRVAVSLSSGGSERGTLHIVDLDGTDVEPPIPNVQRGTAGGDVAWRPDGKALWYTRYPAAGERPEEDLDFWQQIWFHALGTPVEQDRRDLGEDLPRIAEVMLEADARGRLIASVQDGDSGIFRHYLRDTRGRWRRLTDWRDQIAFVGFGPTEDLWLVSRDQAPRGKILRLPAAARKLSQAKVVVPEGKDTIITDYYSERGLIVTGKHVVVGYQMGGPSEVRTFTLAGKPAAAPELPALSSIGKPIRVGDDLLVRATSYVTPSSWYRLRPGTAATTRLGALSPTPPVSLDDFEVARELATSKDGTAVPLNIVWPRGRARDGSLPCLVTGYGGYGVSQEPSFLASLEPLLRRGVCFVEVNLRGGGEFGEAWHRAGMLTLKQNVFDDFAAALQFLIDGDYTASDRLGIIGGSNGGLLMGAILTQHPTLVRAVVSSVGIYDSLRVELSPNGAFNVPEFGSVVDPAQFAALHAYSPYHHVVDGTAYPAILMPTGANDPRVSPWQSRKMVAALQAAQAGDQPILLLSSSTSGHGAGTSVSEAIEQLTDVLSFLLWHLGVSQQ